MATSISFTCSQYYTATLSITHQFVAGTIQAIAQNITQVHLRLWEAYIAHPIGFGEGREAQMSTVEKEDGDNYQCY